MRRRRLLHLGPVVVGLAGLAGGLVWWWTTRSPITQENYDRIEAGWTRARVEALLGPAGDYSAGQVEYDLLTWPGAETVLLYSMGLIDGRLGGRLMAVKMETWQAQAGEIQLWFDEDGRVRAKVFRPPVGPPPGLLTRLRRWFRLGRRGGP